MDIDYFSVDIRQIRDRLDEGMWCPMAAEEDLKTAISRAMWYLNTHRHHDVRIVLRCEKTIINYIQKQGECENGKARITEKIRQGAEASRKRAAAAVESAVEKLTQAIKDAEDWRNFAYGPRKIDANAVVRVLKSEVKKFEKAIVCAKGAR